MQAVATSDSFEFSFNLCC